MTHWLLFSPLPRPCQLQQAPTSPYDSLIAFSTSPSTTLTTTSTNESLWLIGAFFHLSLNQSSAKHLTTWGYLSQLGKQSKLIQGSFKFCTSLMTLYLGHTCTSKNILFKLDLLTFYHFLSFSSLIFLPKTQKKKAQVNSGNRKVGIRLIKMY